MVELSRLLDNSAADSGERPQASEHGGVKGKRRIDYMDDAWHVLHVNAAVLNSSISQKRDQLIHINEGVTLLSED